VSSPVRLLLLSGSPGVDTPHLAATACDALRAAGRPALHACASGPGQTTTYDELWTTLAAGVGEILRGLGLGRLDPQEVGILPALADLAGTLAACRAAEDFEGIVVWDAGTGQAALRAVSSLDTARTLLDRVVTPETTSRARPGLGTQGGALAAVASIRTRIQAAADLLSTSAMGWVMASPGGGSDLEVRRTAAALAMWGIRVEVIDVRDGFADDRILVSAVQGIPETLPASHCVEGSAQDGYRMNVRLEHVQRQWLRVGRTSSALVLAQDGWRRQLALPPTLQRCLLEGAALEDGVLTVRFTPDATAWPSDPSFKGKVHAET